MKKNPPVKLVCLAVALLVVLACSGNYTSQDGFFLADRCRVDVGDELLIRTQSNYPDGASVTIDGHPATIVGQIGPALRVTVPVGVSAGAGKRVTVRNGAVEVSTGNVTIGATTPTGETEPNDDMTVSTRLGCAT